MFLECADTLGAPEDTNFDDTVCVVPAVLYSPVCDIERNYTHTDGVSSNFNLLSPATLSINPSIKLLPGPAKIHHYQWGNMEIMPKLPVETLVFCENLRDLSSSDHLNQHCVVLVQQRLKGN